MHNKSKWDFPWRLDDISIIQKISLSSKNNKQNTLHRLSHQYFWSFGLKVSKSQKQIMVSSFLPKNEQNKFNLWYHSTVWLNFLLVFWENWGYNKLLLRFSDLYLLLSILWKLLKWHYPDVYTKTLCSKSGFNDRLLILM